MSTSTVLSEIIKGYRNVIEDRYQFKKLKAQYQLPASLTATDINNIKTYFLTYIYPDVERRKEMDNAFAALDKYTKRPKTLLSLLAESFKLIFTHGKYLPKILMSGLQAMKSFKDATKFENALVNKAIEQQIDPPYTQAKINSFIQQLPYKEVDEFINSTEDLFLIIHDKVLVEKIQEIMRFLITKMKQKEHLFTKDDVNAVSVALEMIEKGMEMLEKLSPKEQEILIQFITKIERDYIDNLFAKKS